jgi:hypothetical protein
MFDFQLMNMTPEVIMKLMLILPVVFIPCTLLWQSLKPMIWILALPNILLPMLLMVLRALVVWKYPMFLPMLPPFSGKFVKALVNHLIQARCSLLCLLALPAFQKFPHLFLRSLLSLKFNRRQRLMTVAPRSLFYRRDD